MLSQPGLGAETGVGVFSVFRRECQDFAQALPELQPAAAYPPLLPVNSQPRPRVRGWGAGPFPGSHSHYVTEWEPHLCPTPTPLLRSQLFVCSPLPTHQGLQKCMTFKKYLFI